MSFLGHQTKWGVPVCTLASEGGLVWRLWLSRSEPALQAVLGGLPPSAIVLGGLEFEEVAESRFFACHLLIHLPLCPHCSP